MCSSVLVMLLLYICDLLLLSVFVLFSVLFLLSKDEVLLQRIRYSVVFSVNTRIHNNLLRYLVSSGI